MNRAIRLAQLRAAPKGAFLYCSKCDIRMSANPGDYFLTREDYVFKHCKRNLRLMTENVILQEVP